MLFLFLRVEKERNQLQNENDELVVNLEQLQKQKVRIEGGREGGREGGTNDYLGKKEKGGKRVKWRMERKSGIRYSDEIEKVDFRYAEYFCADYLSSSIVESVG